MAMVESELLPITGCTPEVRVLLGEKPGVISRPGEAKESELRQFGFFDKKGGVGSPFFAAQGRDDRDRVV